MTVGELGNVIGGSTPSRAAARYWNGHIPWVTPGELTTLTTKYLRDTREHITQAGLNSCGARLLPGGTLLVTSRATIGSVALVRQPTATNQGFKSIVFARGAEPSFYYYLFQGIVSELERRASGTTFLEVSGREFSAVRLPVPPLPEQQRIAEILDTLDEAIRKTDQLIAKLRQVKQGLLNDLLTRGIDDNGEIRDPDQHPEQFKDSPLGEVPAIWEMSSVDAECEITSGITLGPHREPRHRPWPYLRVANVHRDALDLSDVAQLETMPNESLAGREISAGDLLVVEGHANPAEIGRCAMATPAVAGYTFQNHLFRLRPKRMLSGFCLRWLNSSWTQGYWQRECATSSGLHTINRTRLRRLEVLVPPRDEQHRIVEAVDAAVARIHGEQHTFHKLDLLRRSLLEDLLTGRVRVTSLTEAPA